MPLLNPDLSDVGALPPDVYDATISIMPERDTSKKGNEMVVVDVDIEYTPGKVHTVTDYLVTTGKGARKFGQILRATGFKAEADSFANPQVPNLPFNSDDLLGQHFRVSTEQEEYNGEPKTKIKAYLAAE